MSEDDEKAKAQIIETYITWQTAILARYPRETMEDVAASLGLTSSLATRIHNEAMSLIRLFDKGRLMSRSDNVLNSRRQSSEIDNCRINDLAISKKTLRKLRAAGFNNVGAIRHSADYEILSLPKIGRKTLEEIRTAIEDAQVHYKNR